jgi:hypothetical protein
MSNSIIIRPAFAHEYDEVARVWMDSWISIGLFQADAFLMKNMRVY